MTLRRGHLARKVRHSSIPGEHATCITTHVDALCERLNQVLEEQPAESLGARQGG